MNLTCLQGGCSEDEAPLVGHSFSKCTGESPHDHHWVNLHDSSLRHHPQKGQCYEGEEPENPSGERGRMPGCLCSLIGLGMQEKKNSVKGTIEIMGGV